MANQKQLLNKENWLKYLQLADEGELTNNAKANDIVSMIEKAISVTRCCKELKCKYTIPISSWLNTTYLKKGDEYIHTISKSVHSLEELLLYYDKKISKL